TTNPSLVAKTGRDFETVLREICAIVDGPVSAEVVGTEAAGMVEEGERLARIHRNVVVKCPMIPEGLKATRLLTDRGIRVNVTLVFSTAQALLAAKAGAAFSVLQQLARHALTDVGVGRFLADWRKSQRRARRACVPLHGFHS